MKNLGKITAVALSATLLWTSMIPGQAAFAEDHDHVHLDAAKVLSLQFEDNLNDSSVQENNGTITGDNYSYIDGVDGKALKLEGDTFVDLGTSGTLQPTDLTLSFWFKPDQEMSGEHIITWNKTVYNSDGWYLSSENENKPLAISLGASSDQPYKVSVNGSRDEFFPVDTWTHVAISYDSHTKQVNFYRNGIKQSTNVDYTTPPSTRTQTIPGSRVVSMGDTCIYAVGIRHYQ